MFAWCISDRLLPEVLYVSEVTTRVDSKEEYKHTVVAWSESLGRKLV